VFDIIGKRRWFYLISALVTIPGLIFILATPLTAGATGLKFSIDYTGGTLWEIRFEDPAVTPAQVRAVLAAEGHADSTVVTTSDGYLLIRTEAVGLLPPPPSPSPSPQASASSSASPGASASAGASASPTATPSPSPSASPSPSPSASPSPTPVVGEIPTAGELGRLATVLQAQFGPIDSIREQTTVGPVISTELIWNALVLILVGSIGILTWITVRFRDFKMGVTAITALVHDVVVVVGIFAILGTVAGVQVDGLFVTAMLTIIGFSVHDTIVVYDRIRENRARHAGEPFPLIVNHSILQTIGRSLNTSATVVMTLLALLLFGGEGIRFFVLALLLGIVSGTYSSIFNASALLVTWHEWEAGRKARVQPALARR
jgi:preprotein translocase subunit SecF